MDLPKIKTLIDFVGRTNVTELTVAEKKVTVRIFRTVGQAATSVDTKSAEGEIAGPASPADGASSPVGASSTFTVKAPVFGILHRSPAPGQQPFVNAGDRVEEGQTLFIIEAMKVFNTIAAPHAGRIAYLTDIDGGEVETGDVLAEIV